VVDGGAAGVGASVGLPLQGGGAIDAGYDDDSPRETQSKLKVKLETIRQHLVSTVCVLQGARGEFRVPPYTRGRFFLSLCLPYGSLYAHPDSSFFVPTLLAVAICHL